MAITKTNFINYIRCPRYAALDDLKVEKLDSLITLEEYFEEEEQVKISEILGQMYDENDDDLIDTKNEHLEIMLPFYNKTELLAGNLANKYFKGSFKYSKDTKDQESFDCKINSIRYLCYVDIYNEVDDHFNIIEVKATTTKKYLDIGKKVKDAFGNSKVISIFMKNSDGIYYLLEDLNVDINDYMDLKKYSEYRSKLMDRFSGPGRYIYDLAVQRFIIENDLKQNNQEAKIPKIKYYLAVLNSNYIHNGKCEFGTPVYETDEFGNDIVAYLDMTIITKELQSFVELNQKRVEKYVLELDGSKYPIGKHCENKKTTKCKYSKICWDFIPQKNSILNLLDNHHGFKKNGTKYETFDLLNEGIVNIADIDDSYLEREKNIIQKNVILSHVPYVQLDKIRDGLSMINYPIYHLDFETFPCPLPRFNGEKAYSQSVFQFSIHIEREQNICDKDKDHYEFLANDHSDLREECIKKMLEIIDVDKGGTILVYNESFEKTRLKELGEIFPLYKRKLDKMRDMIFDLMYLVKTSSKLYQELGYEENKAKLFNYYHEDMNGSFSIKKILPLFSELTYKGMEIGNGMEALVCYASFLKMDEKEFNHRYNKLLEYCKQDTWAMVEILRGLRNYVK